MSRSNHSKRKKKLKLAKPNIRLVLPRNKRHKTKKDYNRRDNKVDLRDYNED